MRYLLLHILVLTGFAFSTLQAQEVYEGETVNQKDAEGKKQGVWIKFSSDHKVLEKGNYVNNKKEGLWEAFYSSGQKKHEITYLSNRPDGPAKFFYEDGVVSEEGIWKVNKWVGDYKYYHENGSLKYDWSYNESGRRTGEQRYYYDDGSLMIKGDWTDGKKEGILTEFYQDGSVKSEMQFLEGKVNVSSIKEYTIAQKPSAKQVAPASANKTVTKKPASGDSKDYFTQTGYYKTFNEYKKIDREGDFVKGKLMDGKRYFYDENGDLVKTLIYKGGKVVEAIDNTQ